MKKYILASLVNALSLAGQAQTTTIGGGALPQVTKGGYVSDYSPGGAYILSDGNNSLQNNSTWEHGNAIMDNRGIWNSNTGSTDIFASVGANTISGTNAPGFYNCNFSNAVTTMAITNTNGIAISHTLAFNNGITTTLRANNSAGAINFADDATYTNSNPGDAQYVNGYITKTGNDAFTFPVGNQSGTDLRTLGITSPATTTDALSIAYWQGDVGTNLDPTGGTHSRTSLNPGGVAGSTQLFSVSSIGFWDWVPISGTSQLTIIISIPDFSGANGYVNASSMRIVGWNTSTSQWDNLSGSTGPTSNTEGTMMTGTVSNMSLYSAIAIGNVLPSLPLPVTLISFEVQATATCAAVFNWQTGMENNLDRFYLEYSTDAVSFHTIGSVEAQNSKNGTSYQFSWNDAEQGDGFYRLRTVEQGGSYFYGSVVALQMNCNHKTLTVSPNPATDHVSINGLDGNEQVAVYGTNGQLISEFKTSGSHADVFIGAFANGFYVINITDTKGNKNTFNIVKQ